MTTLWEAALAAGGGEIDRWLEGRSGRRLRLANVPQQAWPLLTAAAAQRAAAEGRRVLVLVPRPDRFAPGLRAWLGGGLPAAVFEEVTVSFLDRPPAYDESVGARLGAVALLAGGRAGVVVSSRLAMLRQTLAPAAADFWLRLAPGPGPGPLRAAAHLVELGYSREALVEAPGQFALRGDILDVYPVGATTPLRCEFFGDELEAIRQFDVANQRSIMPARELLVGPAREGLFGEARGRAAAARVLAEIDLDRLRNDVRADWEDDIARLEAGIAFPGFELFAAYLEPQQPSLLDHLRPSDLVIDFEPRRQALARDEAISEAATQVAAEVTGGEWPAGFRPPMVDPARTEPSSFARIEVSVGEWTDGDDFVDPGWLPAPMVMQAGDIRGLVATGARIAFCTEQTERLEARLAAERVRVTDGALDLDALTPLWEGAAICPIDLPAGFTLPPPGAGPAAAPGVLVLSDAELFGRVRRISGRQLGRKSASTEGRLALELQPGELVVHVDHGIGRFTGMRLVESDGADREYMEIEYSGGDRLFVPVESFDRVQKYMGGGEVTPALHRLGSGDWERARSRARKAAQDVADELLKLYSAREARPGIAFGPDTQWQRELESSFIYDETPDQLTAINEVKADMELARPMDRLLCGDVGFGKTEVAIRAAFKAVNSGYQVAVLCPTTVLAQQHHLVFSERLKNFPVAVEVISRFRTEAEQQAVLDATRAGRVDILIGTHRLLQKDVRFARLGLLIVDEEQRFGVMQKERLKKLRTNIDVLSLSATPIPRTMHMALSGLRDMSVVQTPPEDRQPIKTYVTADDDDLVREVVQRELDRRGQVYYVHNRVRTIGRAAARVERLVPGARVAIGHGQMDEDQLARVMVAFANHEYDVLVCTTIIESGLDMPNVNTLVVEGADRFGLAQLYQLRGRVGRSGRRAYAYFLYDPRRSLTEEADKRLDTLAGLHELGQGFRIALRDLEIRGAGNLLGSEQHGTIAAVGFEMYVQLVQHAVARLRGDQEPEDALTSSEVTVDLPLDHFIPRSYIRDERLRLGAYRELAAADSDQRLDACLRGLRDRYGPPPEQMSNLVYSVRVKLHARRLGLKAVTVDASEIMVRTDPGHWLNADRLSERYGEALRLGPNRIRLRLGDLGRRFGEQRGWREHLEGLLAELEAQRPREAVSAAVG